MCNTSRWIAVTMERSRGLYNNAFHLNQKNLSLAPHFSLSRKIIFKCNFYVFILQCRRGCCANGVLQFFCTIPNNSEGIQPRENPCSRLLSSHTHTHSHLVQRNLINKTKSLCIENCFANFFLLPNENENFRFSSCFTNSIYLHVCIDSQLLFSGTWSGTRFNMLIRNSLVWHICDCVVGGSCFNNSITIEEIEHMTISFIRGLERRPWWPVIDLKTKLKSSCVFAFLFGLRLRHKSFIILLHK